MNELAVAFVARLPGELQAAASEGLAAELEQLIARARSEAPGVELDPIAFVTHVAERVTFDVQGRPRLRTLHAGDLWIAFGCVRNYAPALAIFEQRYVPELRSTLRRSFDDGLAQDAELRLMDKLLFADKSDERRTRSGAAGDAKVNDKSDEGRTRSGAAGDAKVNDKSDEGRTRSSAAGDAKVNDKMLASYAGRGGLVSWLRAAAVRTAIDLMRSRREHPMDLPALALIGGADEPMFAALKQRYREEFRIAFTSAAEQLTDRERALLRYRYLDGLSIDEIGVLYRVHRSTVARWVEAIREGLFEGTRARLVDQLDISESELDSILRMIDSQLEISIEALVR